MSADPILSERILDLRDRVVGWCAPHRRLDPELAADIDALLADYDRLRRVAEAERWTTDGPMVYVAREGDFVGDAATEDDARRFAEWHNAALDAAKDATE